MKLIKRISIYIMCFFYVKIGFDHFVNPEYYLNIVPPYLKFQHELVLISGFFEILFGIGLLTKYRKYSAIGLILLLIAVFPANIFLIENEQAQIALNIDKNIAIIRAPFQLLFIAIAYWHSR
jgi:uncharacterized membrane protein